MGDGMLVNVIPAKARKYVYAGLTLAAIVYGVWQASDGDWGEVIGAVIVALINGMATANTRPTPPPEQ